MFLRTTLLALSLLPSAFGQTQSAPLNANFNGDWAGTLEYRDFTTNAQTFLPTWLTLTPSPDGTTIKFHYVYDDGPTKTVTEDATLTFSPANAKATLTSGKAAETYDVQGLPDFLKQGRGTLLLTGTVKENNHPVDVRLTLTLRRNLYTLRKETHPAGEPFKFRDAYTFTRTVPPAV